MLPILVDVAIACEFDGASSSLQRALNDVVPDLIGHCCDVQIHEKLRDALKLIHGEFGKKISFVSSDLLALCTWTDRGLRCVPGNSRAPVNLAKRIEHHNRSI